MRGLRFPIGWLLLIGLAFGVIILTTHYSPNLPATAQAQPNPKAECQSMTNDYERNLCELWGSVPTPLKKVPDVTTQTKPDDKTPMERAQEKFEADVNAKVLLDAMKRMDFLQRNGGSPIELCVYAGIVTVALVQVRDEARYREWQPIEEGLCRKAGMR